MTSLGRLTSFTAVALIAIGSACGGRIVADDADATDGGVFCSGDAPRVRVNGADVKVLSVRGQAIVLDCCDSADLIIQTDVSPSPFYLVWRAPAGRPPGPVDLASPTATFTVKAALGCDPSSSECDAASGGNAFSIGFQGQIDYTAATASYCVSVVQQSSGAHGFVRSLEIYAPNVPSSL